MTTLDSGIEKKRRGRPPGPQVIVTKKGVSDADGFPKVSETEVPPPCEEVRQEIHKEVRKEVREEVRKEVREEVREEVHKEARKAPGEEVSIPVMKRVGNKLKRI